MLTATQAQRKHGVQRQITTLWVRHTHPDPLAERNGEQIYFCQYCRTPCFSVYGHIVMTMPYEAPVETPVIVNCPNARCGLQYRIESIL